MGAFPALAGDLRLPFRDVRVSGLGLRRLGFRDLGSSGLGFKDSAVHWFRA